MNKIKHVTLAVLLLGFVINASTPIAMAASQTVEPSSNSQIVTGQGLFTPSTIKSADKCTEQQKMKEGQAEQTKRQGELKDEFGLNKSTDDNSTGKVGSLFAKLMIGMTDEMMKFFDVSCASTNFLSEVTKIATPLNLTNNSVIMSVMGVTQMIALGASVVFVAVFGVMYSLGYQKLNPVNFAMRLFAGMLAVYLLPYLIQDILNINNMLVYYISHMPMSGNVSDSISIALVYIVGNMLMDLATVAATGGGLIVIIGVIILLIIWAAVYIFKLIAWWYMRMLMIFVLCILGPFFVIMMCLPQTASYASKWLKALIAETYTQLFMAIGLYFFVDLFLNMQSFMDAVQIGGIGEIFLFYIGLMFLAGLPEMAKGFIGGGVTAPGTREAMAAAAMAGATMATFANKGSQKYMESQAKKKLDDNINKQGDKMDEKVGKGFESAMDSMKNESFEATGNQLFKEGENGQMEMLLGDETSGVEFNPFTNVDSNAMEEIAMGAGTRDEKVQAMADELMKFNPDRYDEENQFQAKADADKLMTQIESQNAISGGALGEIRKLQASGDLDSKKFEGIIKDDVHKNLGLYENKYFDQLGAKDKENWGSFSDNEKANKLSKVAMDEKMYNEGWNEVVQHDSPRDKSHVQNAPKVDVGKNLVMEGGQRKVTDVDRERGTDHTGRAKQYVDYSNITSAGAGNSGPSNTPGGGGSPQPISVTGPTTNNQKVDQPSVSGGTTGERLTVQNPGPSPSSGQTSGSQNKTVDTSPSISGFNERSGPDKEPTLHVQNPGPSPSSEQVSETQSRMPDTGPNTSGFNERSGPDKEERYHQTSLFDEPKQTYEKEPEPRYEKEKEIDLGSKQKPEKEKLPEIEEERFW